MHHDEYWLQQALTENPFDLLRTAALCADTALRRLAFNWNLTPICLEGRPVHSLHVDFVP